MRPINSEAPRIGLLSAWLSRNNGGVFEAVAAHTAVVRASGFTPVVIGLTDALSEADRDRLLDGEVHAAQSFGPAQFGYAPDLGGVLSRARIDLLHLHGVWMYQSRAAVNWAKATGRPLLVSPHGMLSPWITRRGRMKKAIARAVYERASWDRADAFHALTEFEAADITAVTGRQETLIIPNPGPLPTPHRTRLPLPEVVYIGRIHPKKNLGALIDGWRLAADVLAPQQARLTIAGWGDRSHVRSLTEKITRAGDAAIRFIGPVYGEEKERLLMNARFVALPSLSEGLPVAMLEAWAAGTPTLMSRRCNLPQGFAAVAAIDSGTTPVAIGNALCQAFRLDDAGWISMSHASTALARTCFSTETVTMPWLAAYRGLLQGRSQRPAFSAYGSHR